MLLLDWAAIRHFIRNLRVAFRAPPIGEWLDVPHTDATPYPLRLFLWVFPMLLLDWAAIRHKMASSLGHGIPATPCSIRNAGVQSRTPAAMLVEREVRRRVSSEIRSRERRASLAATELRQAFATRPRPDASASAWRCQVLRTPMSMAPSLGARLPVESSSLSSSSSSSNPDGKEPRESTTTRTTTSTRRQERRWSP